MDPNFRAIDLICDLVDQSNGAAEIVSLESSRSVLGRNSLLRDVEIGLMRFRLMQLLTIVAIGAAGGRAAFPQGFLPEEAARRMTVAKGLKVTLFAGEPTVRQSIFVKCDDRGRFGRSNICSIPIRPDSNA